MMHIIYILFKLKQLTSIHENLCISYFCRNLDFSVIFKNFARLFYATLLWFLNWLQNKKESWFCFRREYKQSYVMASRQPIRVRFFSCKSELSCLCLRKNLENENLEKHFPVKAPYLRCNYQIIFTYWKIVHQIIMDSIAFVVLNIPMMNYFHGRYHVQVADSERKFSVI